eukprot:CAMPEP_0181040000 /NCGR_PEP_ID=MMETSP1070-20121207/10801_1 /TAXON_ID=265543 /ORGANISM="Minutocellus polymorphus, Strain NH13" /LENGTH=450 /DNA_ID=CAMNT_0023117953 /DNA_START=248 /DNA_END=1600 /DNA_ORIENTATION=-
MPTLHEDGVPPRPNSPTACARPLAPFDLFPSPSTLHEDGGGPPCCPNSPTACAGAGKAATSTSGASAVPKTSPTSSNESAGSLAASFKTASSTASTTCVDVGAAAEEVQQQHNVGGQFDDAPRDDDQVGAASNKSPAVVPPADGVAIPTATFKAAADAAGGSSAVAEGNGHTYTDFSNLKPEDMRGASKKVSGLRGRREPSFVVKLHSILTNPAFEDIISWLPHGRAWRVHQRGAFEEHVMRLYFRHGKHSSFMRQVNGWGFQRIFQGPDYGGYYHELFLRGMPHLAMEMRRPSQSWPATRERAKITDCSLADPPDFYKMTVVGQTACDDKSSSTSTGAIRMSTVPTGPAIPNYSSKAKAIQHSFPKTTPAAGTISNALNQSSVDEALNIFEGRQLQPAMPRQDAASMYHPQLTNLAKSMVASSAQAEINNIPEELMRLACAASIITFLR